jgi:Rrf2 family protein
MMELPQSTEWALHCCWLLAQTDGKSTLPRRRIAEFFELPEPYLAKVLKQLVSAGILTSVSGVNGGFRLARPASQITALDVVTAIDGGGSLFHCTEIRQKGPVPLTAQQCTRPCGIAKIMHDAELIWRRQLASTSIADLINQAAPPSQQRAARWLGPQARPEIASAASGAAAD